MGKDARVELPKTYTRDDIPTKREEIPRPETAKVWPHLSGIASKLYPYQVDVEVGGFSLDQIAQAPSSQRKLSLGEAVILMPFEHFLAGVL